MRVAVDARVATDHFPGIGRAAVQLTRALATQLSADELWAVRDRNAAPALLGEPSGRPLPCAASPFSIAQQWEVPRALRGARITVYHSLYFGMPAFPGVPTVWTCHDLIPFVVPGTFDARQRAMFGVLCRLAARAAKRIVSVSAATKRDLVDHLGIAPERIDVVPWGVDARYRVAESPPDPARAARLGLPARYLLYVGINKPHKNLPVLVRAVARAQAARPARDLQLVVAGPWDPRYPEARDAATAAGLGERVRFLGPVAEGDLPALYAGASMFVFPSLYEGFGLPVLEAMASGAPVVTSDRSSLPEVAGDAALLVPPTNEEAIADAIGRLADDPGLRAELARRGRARAAEFTWEKTAQRLVAIYRAVAEVDGRPAPETPGGR